jgi:hypothetical protein
LRASNPCAIVIHGRGRRSVDHLPTATLIKRNTTMAAMKKKKKAKKAAKK